MTTPTVSVIIPVHDVEDYLREALDSVFAQDHPALQVLVIDDGSTDSSPDILAEYLAGGHEFTLITQENRGLSAARNVGLDHATGDYIQFLDSDDVLRPGALSAAVAAAQAEDLDVVLFDADVIGDTTRRREDFYRRPHRFPTCSGARMALLLREEDSYRDPVYLYLARREQGERALRFLEGALFEDIAYTTHRLARARRVGHLHRPLIARRMRDGSITDDPEPVGQFLSYCRALTASHRLGDHRGPRRYEAICRMWRSLLQGIVRTAERIPEDSREHCRREYRPVLALARRHDWFGDPVRAPLYRDPFGTVREVEPQQTV